MGKFEKGSFGIYINEVVVFVVFECGGIKCGVGMDEIFDFLW